MYKETIGIVGGFGGFATADFFRRLLETFFTGYERDYPRIVMDNDFTMTSRTRGLLYDEQIEQITEMMAASVKNLISIGADRIVLPCGTAHWYLDGVYRIVPEAKGIIVDIVDATGEKLMNCGVKSCYVVAAEGTLKKKLYNQRFAKYSVEVSSPSEEDWPRVRYFIEATKQNRITSDIKKEFIDFILNHTRGVQPSSDGKVHVILGCTELPLLVDEDAREKIAFEDPLDNALTYLKENLR